MWRSKYKATKVVVDGIKFDSKRESERYRVLKKMEDEGDIKDLKMQVKFELIPSQRVDGKVVERPCNYIADFTYFKNGEMIVEDSKGMKTKDYIIKRKLMLSVHGLQVHEV